MRLRAETWIRGTAEQMGCEVNDGGYTATNGVFRSLEILGYGHLANLVLARTVGINAAEPWYQFSHFERRLNISSC